MLTDLSGYFLGAQVVMIGLLFPVAIGLRTLIIQRESVAAHRPRFRVRTMCRCFFGTSDPETAKLVSDMCGTMTVPVTTFSESAGPGAGFGGKVRNEALSYTSQPLMTPQEVMSMDRCEQLVFIRDEQPIKGIKVAYFEKPAFEGLYEEWKPEARQPEAVRNGQGP